MTEPLPEPAISGEQALKLLDGKGLNVPFDRFSATGTVQNGAVRVSGGRMAMDDAVIVLAAHVAKQLNIPPEWVNLRLERGDDNRDFIVMIQRTPEPKPPGTQQFRGRRRP